MKKNFPITRIYCGSDGESYFEDILVPMHDAGDIGSLSEATPVKTIIFREVEPAYNYNFHNAPQRQYIILLDGGIQVETSLGDIRILNAGEILLAEDTTGKGHRTKNIEQKKRKSIFVTF